MAPVGRPPSRTRLGNSAPTRELGVPDMGLGGYGVVGAQNVFQGGSGPWRMYVDEWEYVPELRWPLSVRLHDQMRTDSQLAGLLTAVMWGIAQLRYVVDPNGARPSLVQEVSQDLNLPILGKDDQPRGRMKNRFAHSKFITQAMLAAIYGHMYFNQVGTIVDGKWRLRKLAPRMPQTIRAINVADDGGLVSVQQWAPLNGLVNPVDYPEIPVDNLVAFVFSQEGMSWTGRSMMRDCYKDWLLKDRNLRVEAINHERAGGVPWAEGAEGMSVDEITDLDQMMQHFRIGENSGGALPHGAKLNIAKGTGSDVDRTIKRIDESMARRFLLQLANLAQGGGHVGSYALGETFEDFFLVGQRHIAQWYCDTVTEHVIEDMVDWNYGEDEELAPRITWERTSEDALSTDQLALLVQRGIIVVDEELEDVIRYRNMLPKRKGPRPELITPGGPRQPTEQQAITNPNTEPTVPGTRAAGSPVAPFRNDPAETQASFLQRVFRRKPQVMAAGPTLVTVPNVPILEAGVLYHLSTGPTTFTPEDLADAVTAANEDKSIPAPRIWIGHIDPRFNDTNAYDGTPSFATARNLRLSENGMRIDADYVGVPEWLAPLLPTAYPSRSIEGFWDVESMGGKKWKFVISSCKVLGVTWPGINQLEDLPAYYGKDVPPGVVIDHEAIAAAQSQPGGDPLKTWASAHLEDVRRQFFSEYVPKTGKPDWWIRAALTDPNELIVEDDETGQLYRIPFTSGDNNDVSFGEAEAVRIGIIPDNKPELLKAAASHTAATLELGREVLASWPSRAESRPEPTGGGSMDPKEIRNRLNLPEDASDEQVREAIKAMNTAVGLELKETPDGGSDGEGGEGTGGEGGEGEGGEAVVVPPVTIAASALPPGTVLVDEGTLKALQAGAQIAVDLKSQQDKNGREAAVAAAIGDGRIPASRKDHWLNYLEQDPGGHEVLAKLEPNIVPVQERGHGHAPDTSAASQVAIEDELVATWTEALFPEVRESHARDRAAASGEHVPRRSRVQSDANYAR